METLKIAASSDNLLLSVAYVEPSCEPRGIVQLVHGMCEHKERYYAFMNYLADNGYVVVIHDHRGHGASVRCMEDLGYMYAGGWLAMVEDVEVVRAWSEGKWPGLKRKLFGHSMGSMVVRSYVKRYDSRIDRLFVCGSPSANPLAGFGKFLASCFMKFKGDHYRPQLLQSLSFDAYNKPFAADGFPSAWVCSDHDVLVEYHRDPLCQFTFTANGFYNLMGLMQDCYSADNWVVANPHLPVHFISGELDPCRTNDKAHQASVDLLKRVGYSDVTSVIYPGMRHEILNETGKSRVWEDVLAQIAHH